MSFALMLVLLFVRPSGFSASEATNEELGCRACSSPRSCSRACRSRGNNYLLRARDHHLHVRGAGAVLELHRRACRLSVVRDRGVLRPRRLCRRRSCRATACRCSPPGAAPALSALVFAALLGGAILHLRGHYFAIAPDRRRGAARDRQRHGRLHRRRQGPQPADPAQFGRSAGAVLLLRHARACVSLHAPRRSSVDRSKLGFGLRCIQQNEDAANMLGVNTYGYKTAAFCALGRVRRHRRRDLRLLDRLHRAARRVRHPDRRQGAGHGAARRARHDPRSGHRRASSCSLRGGGLAELPHDPRGSARPHHRRPGAVPAGRPLLSLVRDWLGPQAERRHERAARTRRRVAPLRRPPGRRRRELVARAGRDRRPDRPERRRQDHAGQPDHRRASGDRRARPLRGSGRHAPKPVPDRARSASRARSRSCSRFRT